MKKSMIALASALACTACASVAPARMVMPTTLADAETLSITGIGGGQTGSFSVGALSGSFTRSDTRLGVFEPIFERRDGRTRFDLSGPGLNGRIQADCKMRERTIGLSVIAVEVQPMAYRCTFDHEGRALPARFELQAVRNGLSGMMMRQERRGEIAFGGVILQIRSIHHVQGSPLELATPVGFLVERGGVSVGAVQVNGTPVVSVQRDANDATRQAIMIAAVALGLFWDPANSALGREAG